ncbi:hypothetical protein [Microbacterium lushaniae]|uniref:Uncharacterized protein n=1 Tax=Microbacterium lushaniae TaxID=2614639 RepID=A0A5J6L8D9_9MICO|nr:hypothetical protein [Microbacterium lushaniae]QEW04690.1 hypothetical protein F6J85_17450 [Microbacterium lushaniae]
MSDGVQYERSNATRSEERRLHAGMGWLVAGSVIALTALVAWGILSAANGSAAGMVAASSGSVAVAVAWSTGFLAFKRRLSQIRPSTGDVE